MYTLNTVKSARNFVRGAFSVALYLAQGRGADAAQPGAPVAVRLAERQLRARDARHLLVLRAEHLTQSASRHTVSIYVEAFYTT